MANTRNSNEPKAVSINRIKKDVTGSNKLFNNLIQEKIAPYTTGPNTISRNRIDNIQSAIDDCLSGEINNIHSFTNGDSNNFFLDLFNKNDMNSRGLPRTNNYKSLDDVFRPDVSELIDFFNERYKNRYYIYEDLNMLTSELPEFKEAVMVTRDAIVTADDRSSIINARKEFNGVVQKDELNTYMAAVDNVEKQHKLLQKLKAHIIPKTLIYGEYYAYIIPYRDICARYEDVQSAVNNTDSYGNSIRMSQVRESVQREYLDTLANVNNYTDKNDFTAIVESFNSMSTRDYSDPLTNRERAAKGESVIKKGKVDEDLLMEVTNEILGNIDVNNSADMDPEVVLEGGIDEVAALVASKDVQGIYDVRNILKKNEMGRGHKDIYNDGVKEYTDINDTTNPFKDVIGSHLKLVAPTRMIPIKIMNNYIIGYYYIHAENVRNTIGTGGRGPMTTNQLKLSAFYDSEAQRENVETKIVNMVTTRIVQSFDQKFLENNKNFKDLIFNSLLYHDIYRRKVKFQFVPADLVVRFSVNENEDGDGESMLKDALWYAKLYHSLLIFKMMAIINNSIDKTVYYLRDSGVDTDIINKTQDAARQVYMSQMNYKELINANSASTKLGAGRSIFMPMGSSGEKAIDIDVIQGQDIPLDTELMNKLHTMFINATGVPDVIMEYVNAADYAKSLEMANTKFAGKILSYIAELNDPTTELYQKLLRYDSSIELEDICKFEFAYNPPKDLAMNNFADRAGNIENICKIMVDAKMGTQSDQTEAKKKVYDVIYNDMIREEFPNLPWDVLDKAVERANVTVPIHLQADKLQNENAMGGGAPEGGEPGAY